MSRTDSPQAITIESAQGLVGQALRDAFNKDKPVLIEALPSIGKSYGVVQWAAKTGKPLTVFTARHELYDQYTEWCEKEGLIAETLPSFHADCETANGTHGDEWAKRVKRVYREKGLRPGEIHHNAESLFDQSLPCQADGDCSYFSARDIDLVDCDVLIGHYTHAHVPQRTAGRYVVFDEFPEDDFLIHYSESRITTAVTAFLQAHEDLPFEYLKDLREYRHDPDKYEAGCDWFEENHRSLKRDISSILDDKTGRTHPDGPVLTYAILTAESLDNRWEFTRLPDDRTAVIDPNDNSITILNPPTLDGAHSVVALDGTPTFEKWRLMLGENLTHHRVMSPDQKGAYLRDMLGLRIIQTSWEAKPYSGRAARNVTPENDLTLFEGITKHEGKKPTLISSKSAIREYTENQLANVVSEWEHYGNLKGSNRFSNTRLGCVAGSPHYGDGYIQKWVALAGKSTVRVEDTDGIDVDYGEHGNKILVGMRENAVLQAIMRFGREGGGATVYVHTAAIPEWVDTEVSIAKIRKWPPGMKAVIEAIEDFGLPEWRTKDIADRVSVVNQDQVRIHLHTLEEHNYVSHRKEGRGFTWSNECLDEVGELGQVVFSPTAS